MSLLPFFILLPLGFMLAALAAGRLGGYLIVLAAPVMIALSVVFALDLQGAPAIVELGGWAPPLGIRLRADGFAAALLVAASITASLVGLFALGEFGPRMKDDPTGRATFWPLFYALWAAVSAVFASHDLFNLYIALEFLTIAAVALTAFGSRSAALRYFLAGMLGSLAYLLGVVLIYARYATLDITLLSANVEADIATLLAAGLMSAGLLVKTALFPMHAWLPPAHGSAPTPASALLSGLVVKAGFFVLLTLWFGALPELAGPAAAHAFGILGSLAVVYGSILALRQSRLKMLIAYSTVAQLGYLVLVFPLAGAGGEATPWPAGAWSGMGFHALSHMMAKAGMFLAAGLMIAGAGDDRIEAMTGLARAMPVTVFAFALCSLSIMALPPSGGFMAKYLLLTAALGAGQWGYALVLIAGGLLAAAYLFRPLSRFMQGGKVPKLRQRPHRALPAIPLALGALTLALGLLSATPHAFIQNSVPGAGGTGLAAPGDGP